MFKVNNEDTRTTPGVFLGEATDKNGDPVSLNCCFTISQEYFQSQESRAGRLSRLLDF